MPVVFHRKQLGSRQLRVVARLLFDPSANSVKFKSVTSLGDVGWYGPFPMGVEDEGYELAVANATAFCSWISSNRIGNASVELSTSSRSTGL